MGILKADDDTYIHMLALRRMLASLPSDPILLGHKQVDLGVTYASGGPGYILSSSALFLIAEKGLGSDGLCHFPHPVGTEVTVSVPNSMLLFTFDQDIYPKGVSDAKRRPPVRCLCCHPQYYASPQHGLKAAVPVSSIPT